ncbi:FadR/GntR family transcriptional regulator [Lipingzhangella sp. LS1_29]|uniref:FadR/GntR family transcriptional regulator n=1 Tax=Lipingzhangella rawalii TaxID=2055835 RepID=A0ABU2H0S1_9ACTN|nr:FadR/GntR family transcriptional regulator [Lipingzhangella rawalii]MDS1268897.1 FadR/GntR family transcriptional regulator [Lipingzhangella rawalii]
MPLASTRRTGLVDQVIAQLRAQVDSGEWAIGDRIPTESELADQLEVGRNTVREAVRALAHAGLLEIRQGAGTFVRASSELGGALRRRVERSRLRESLEVRRALELESARLAADRRTEADLAEMDHALQLAERALAEGDMTAFVEADVGLHHTIVQASHNSLLIELYGDIAQVVHETVSQAVQEHSGEHPIVDHRSLVEAIRAGDVAAATRETACYIDEGLTTMGQP